MIKHVSLTVHIVGVCPWTLLLLEGGSGSPFGTSRCVRDGSGDDVGTLLEFGT